MELPGPPGKYSDAIGIREARITRKGPGVSSQSREAVIKISPAYNGRSFGTSAAAPGRILYKVARLPEFPIP